VTADALSWQLSEEDWDRVLAVNLKGAFLCAQAALRPILRQRNGHIINIGSFSGRAGQLGQANYAAAKAGLIGLTESLAKEVGSRNVRVNAVLPGVLPTSMTAKLSEAQLAEYAAANALGRINSLTEVAQFIVFLATMQNVSGQVFQLDSRIARWT
jgi:3-oxoacyl-[acyl-carrier protein] reductase